MNVTSRMATGVLATAALLAQAFPAVAAAPGSVRDLVSARAAGGESTLEQRGFTMVHGMTQDGGKITFWWNPNTKECVKVDTYDGKFASIDQVSNADCNQRASNGADKTAAVAIGAAAILGIAALASKSHQRGDRYQDENSTAEYERGYRDGLYNQSYHNYTRSDAYSNGYSSGVEQRGHETRYRSNNYYAGGYSDFARVNDLEGRSRDSAGLELMNRGFALRDNKKVEDGRYMTYWRAVSRQCVILHSQGGYVVSLESVSARTCSY